MRAARTVRQAVIPDRALVAGGGVAGDRFSVMTKPTTARDG